MCPGVGASIHRVVTHHSAVACMSLGLNKRTTGFHRSCGCDGPAQAQISPSSSVPYQGTTWALKGHLWSQPGCFQKQGQAPCFSSLHTRFLPSSQLLWCIFTFSGEDAAVHKVCTCSQDVPKKQRVLRQRLKTGGHFSEKTSSRDGKHSIPNGLGIPVTASVATVSWKCQRKRQGAAFWSQLGGTECCCWSSRPRRRRRDAEDHLELCARDRAELCGVSAISDTSCSNILQRPKVAVATRVI